MAKFLEFFFLRGNNVERIASFGVKVFVHRDAAALGPIYRLRDIAEPKELNRQLLLKRL